LRWVVVVANFLYSFLQSSAHPRLMALINSLSFQ
jgi:hypothetical protein